MACNHRLDADYVGLFCPYCGDAVAEINKEYGQIVLRDRRSERPKRPRYIAVVRGSKQRVVEEVQVNSAETVLTLSGEPSPIEMLTPLVLMAFQDPEEKLEL
jgi:hypothetical protein